MRFKKAEIDSLNLSSYDIEKMFTDKEHYIIEPIKSIGVFEPKRWIEEFGKPLSRNIIEASILHTSTGLAIPLKRYAVSPQNQTIEFVGLHGYNDRSLWLMALLRDKWSQSQQARIIRIDIAMDYKRFPSKVKNMLLGLDSRHIKVYKHSEYLKTVKEGKTNPYMNIIIYDKGIKEGLDYSLTRLEFSFRGNYFDGLLLKDINEAKKKMEKSIKKIVNIDVKIEGF